MLPKNILMIGPTGCGKTEISRRLARLAGAPFLKVEATKFTEVGYVGRDVDSIVRDLVEVGIGLTREAKRREVRAQAEKNAEERVLDALVGPGASAGTRESFRRQLRNNQLNDKEIEIQVAEAGPQFPSFDIPGRPGRHDQSQRDAWARRSASAPSRASSPSARPTTSWSPRRATSCSTRTRWCRTRYAPSRTTASCSSTRSTRSARARRRDASARDVSREGVQRDLLPLIEGTTVSTKYGPVKTDHVLFIASGAFHAAKPSDLLPELQGRLPIRVELKPLTTEDLRRILTEPEASLIKQYVGADADRGRDAASSPTTPSMRWPTSPRRSTPRSRTSARAACRR